ncbi:MAG: DNA primase [Actinomycetota bacterium]|nr:DNA primase [Actinomycetota bacterium]
MAKIKEEDIDGLRERANIVDVVAGYTHLKKSGGQTLKGLCPFHSEKTPSFTVDAGGGLFHCFGCGESGNVYQFIQKVEALSFPDAVEWLARKTGYELHHEEARPGDREKRGVKARLVAANNSAAEFFHRSLFTADAALPARRYLEDRGFGREVAQRWKLGFAPGRDALCRHLMANGFSAEELVQADLVRKSDRDGSLYDTFRERITFPTWNLNDDVVGFGARALGDQQPKYLNSSETPVFTKSRIMYGLNRAKRTIARTSTALVVEGYTDVIALHEAGIDEAVATNGVALGENHFELLKRFADRAVLMFDADEAGKSATERGFGMHHRIGLEVLVAPLPSGHDPADAVRESGPELIRKVVDDAQPILEFKLEQTLAKVPLDTPEARARAVREAVEVLGLHPDPIARGQYAFIAAQRIGIEPEAVQRALNDRSSRGPGATGGVSDREPDRRFPGHVKVEREALRLLLTRTRDIAPWAAQISESDFTSPPRRELFREALQAVTSTNGSVGAGISERLTEDARQLFAELSMTESSSSEEEWRTRADEVFIRLQVFRLEREIKQRRNTLQDINPLDQPQRHDELFTKLVGLEASRRDLLRRIEGAV